MRYLVVWSGGYEEPSLFLCSLLPDAERKFSEWRREFSEDSDRIAIYDLDSGIPKEVKSAFYEPEDI